MFASRLRELRNHAHLTQAKLAELMGVSQQAVGLWERRKNMPSHDLIAKIASHFNVTTDYLLGLSDSAHKNIQAGYDTPALQSATGIAENNNQPIIEPLTAEEKAIIKAYRIVPEHIKDIVKTALRLESP